MIRLPALRLAQAALILLSLGGAAVLCLQVARLPDHPLADMTHLTWWTRMVQREGVEMAYAGTYPETYVIYPAGMAYAFQAAARLSEAVAPPPWVSQEDWLRQCVKLIAVGGHVALAVALFSIVAAAAGFWRGWIAATLYAWNPAAIFDTAYWGQADSLHSLAVTLALGAVFAVPGWWPLRHGGRWRWWQQLTPLLAGAVTGAVLAAGGLTKPQAWVFLPMVLWLAWRRLGPLGLAAAATAGGVVAWAMLLPWTRTGRLPEALSVFQNLQEVMPSVSANGHNLWWIKLPGVAIQVLDWQPLGGVGEWNAPDLLTFSTAGRLLFGLFALLPLLRLTGPVTVRIAFAAAAYTAMAYFMAITQVHENHMFAAIPFLAAAAALDVWLAPVFVIASVCAFFNLALADFLIGDHLTAAILERFPQLPAHDPVQLQTLNAMLNVAGFAVFTVLLLRRPPAARQTARALRWRARGVLLGGVALAGGALGALEALLRRPDLLERVWERMTAATANVGPVEAKLGHKTPQVDLLARAAVDLANDLYLLAGVAAIVGTVAALAGLWWCIVSRFAPRESVPPARRRVAQRVPSLETATIRESVPA